MSRRRFVIALLACGLLASCSAPAPTWRVQAARMVDKLERQGAPQLLPQEYKNLLETFEHGEAVFFVRKSEQNADDYYLLVLQKGDVLRDELQRHKERLLAEERRRAVAEAARREEERMVREAAQAVERQRQLEQAKTADKVAVKAAAAPAARKSAPPREAAPSQPAAYTVRRGETLPQIAARVEIYNDSSLWPLIYRSNRDQIRDPKRLWPGQVLRIPRHFSRDEALEAKRYSSRK